MTKNQHDGYGVGDADCMQRYDLGVIPLRVLLSDVEIARAEIPVIGSPAGAGIHAHIAGNDIDAAIRELIRQLEARGGSHA